MLLSKVLYVTSISQRRNDLKHTSLHSLNLSTSSENDSGILDEVVAVSALNNGINP